MSLISPSLSSPKTVHSRNGKKCIFQYDGAGTVFKLSKSIYSSFEFCDVYFKVSELPFKARQSFDYAQGDIIPLRKARQFFKLSNCGKWGEVQFICKSCKEVGRDGHLKTTHKEIVCGSRYCTCTKCLVSRFASTFEQFNNIKGLAGLKLMQHWSMGFKAVPLSVWKKDWRQMKKDHEYTMNSYWAKMKKKGLVLEGIRVLDFSFEKNGMVFPHYHFALKPFKNGQARQGMQIINDSRHELLDGKRRRVQDFIFKKHGKSNKPKGAILAYLAKRSAGIYKHGEGKNLKWDTGEGALKKAIESGKYFYLSDFTSMDEFLDLFYSTRHFSTIGGLPRGTKPMDSIKESMPDYCPFCKKELSRCDLFVHTIIGVPPPPNIKRKTDDKEYVFMRGV